jgi:hypothetical protein
MLADEETEKELSTPGTILAIILAISVPSIIILDIIDEMSFKEFFKLKNFSIKCQGYDEDGDPEPNIVEVSQF